MEARELAKKFRNNPQTENSYQHIIKWCSENAKNLDLTDKDQHYLFEMSTRYLMKTKIRHWNKDDVTLIINYFVKSYLTNYEINNDDVTVTILNDSEYMERFNDNSRATCIR